MLRSLGLGLGLETFAKFVRVSFSVSKNLVSEKKSQFRFRKIWYRKKSLGIGFGQNFGIVIQWCQAVKSLINEFFKQLQIKIWDLGKHADYNQTSVAVKHDNVLFIQFKLVGKIPNICCAELSSQNVSRQK